MELKIDYNHTLQDFKKIEEIEKGYLAINTIAPSHQTFEWHNANKDIHIGVRDTVTDEIIGSIAIIPLNKKQYNKFILNELEDTELNSSNIEEYKEGKEYYLLFSAITIQKEYRNNRYVLYLLLKGFYDKLLDLKYKDINFINMCAEGQTKDGQKFIESFLDLKFYKKTKDNYNIYCYEKDYEDFNKWLENFPNYIESYYNKFII